MQAMSLHMAREGQNASTCLSPPSLPWAAAIGCLARQVFCHPVSLSLSLSPASQPSPRPQSLSLILPPTHLHLNRPARAYAMAWAHAIPLHVRLGIGRHAHGPYDTLLACHCRFSGMPGHTHTASNRVEGYHTTEAHSTELLGRRDKGPRLPASFALSPATEAAFFTPHITSHYVLSRPAHFRNVFSIFNNIILLLFIDCHHYNSGVMFTSRDTTYTGIGMVCLGFSR